MKIGVLGLGKMGSGIASNLLKAGHEVAVWNRSAAKAEALIAQGARLAATAREAAAVSDVVITMLADDAALHSVTSGKDGLMAGLAANALHISMSTIAVATADLLKQQHAGHQQRFLSAPVFGRPEAAAAAKLFILAAGEDSDLQTAAPIFSAMSQRVFKLGTNQRSANLVKLSSFFHLLTDPLWLLHVLDWRFEPWFTSARLLKSGLGK